MAISPSEETKFLGIIVENKLSFSSHVDHIISKCNSRLLLMRQLKMLGLNAAGLKTFYTSTIRSLLLYGAPAWHSILNSTNKDKLELVQRSASICGLKRDKLYFLCHYWMILFLVSARTILRVSVPIQTSHFLTV